jgi:hypothetical protein
MSWVEAIKKYAEMNGGKFVIPKRDSEDYAKVKAIQERMTKGEKIEVPKAKSAKPEKVANKEQPLPAVAEEAPKKRKSIPKPVKVANVDVTPVEPAPDAPKKEKKVRAKKEKTANVPVVEAVEPVADVKACKAKKEKKANVDVAVEEKVEVEEKERQSKRAIIEPKYQPKGAVIKPSSLAHKVNQRLIN